MRNTLFALAAMLFFTVSVRAASVQPTVEIGALQIKASGTTVNANPLASTVYQDWGSATGDQPAGAGALQGSVATGLNTINGDDANMLATAVGQKLTSMGFSVSDNNPSSGGLDGWGVVGGTIQFFRQSDLSSIGGFNWSIDFGGALNANSFRIFYNDGALDAANIVFDTPNVYITNKITTATSTAGGLDPSQLGFQIRNPVGPIGSSADKMILNGAVVNSPFGNNPPGNESWSVRVVPVPEPTSVALLALGGAAVLARRRND